MKKGFKLLALTLIICIAASMFVAILSGCESADVTITVYNWAEYIDIGDEEAGTTSVIDDFEAYYESVTGKTVEVKYVEFDTNENMLSKVLEGGYEADLICPSEYAIERLIKEGKLQQFDKTSADLTNANSNINKVFKDKLDANFGEEFYNYVVPYMWGTLGILYTKSINGETIITEDQIKKAGWGILWNDVEDEELKEKLTGKIYMKNSVRDAYVAAVMRLKEEGDELAKTKSAQELINITYDEKGNLTGDSTKIAAKAFAEIAAQTNSGYLKGYEVDYGKEDLIAGTAYVDLAWSGDAFYAIEKAEEAGVELGYYAPEVGGNLWFDAWVMTKREDRTDDEAKAANMFVDYLCTPEVAMRNMMYIGYISAVDKDVFLQSEEAKAILTDTGYDVEKYFNDTNRYPTEAEMANLGVMKDFGAALSTMNASWQSAKVEGSNNDLFWIIFVCVAIAVVLGAVGFMAYKFRDKKKSKKRRKVVKR